MTIAARCAQIERSWSALFVSIFLSLTALPTQAAEIVPVRGDVLASTGAGYHPVGERTKLNEGDSVIVGPESQGSLVYADGCAVDVVPGMIAWVATKSPCADGAAKANALSPLTPTKSFKRDWLVGGVSQLKRTTIPAGP